MTFPNRHNVNTKISDHVTLEDKKYLADEDYVHRRVNNIGFPSNKNNIVTKQKTDFVKSSSISISNFIDILDVERYGDINYTIDPSQLSDLGSKSISVDMTSIYEFAIFNNVTYLSYDVEFEFDELIDSKSYELISSQYVYKIQFKSTTPQLVINAILNSNPVVKIKPKDGVIFRESIDLVNKKYYVSTNEHGLIDFVNKSAIKKEISLISTSDVFNLSSTHNTLTDISSNEKCPLRYMSNLDVFSFIGGVEIRDNLNKVNEYLTSDICIVNYNPVTNIKSVASIGTVSLTTYQMYDVSDALVVTAKNQLKAIYDSSTADIKESMAKLSYLIGGSFYQFNDLGNVVFSHVPLINNGTELENRDDNQRKEYSEVELYNYVINNSYDSYLSDVSSMVQKLNSLNNNYTYVKRESSNISDSGYVELSVKSSASKNIDQCDMQHDYPYSKTIFGVDSINSTGNVYANTFNTSINGVVYPFLWTDIISGQSGISNNITLGVDGKTNYNIAVIDDFGNVGSSYGEITSNWYFNVVDGIVQVSIRKHGNLTLNTVASESAIPNTFPINEVYVLDGADYCDFYTSKTKFIRIQNASLTALQIKDLVIQNNGLIPYEYNVNYSSKNLLSIGLSESQSSVNTRATNIYLPINNANDGLTYNVDVSLMTSSTAQFPSFIGSDYHKALYFNKKTYPSVYVYSGAEVQSSVNIQVESIVGNIINFNGDFTKLIKTVKSNSGVICVDNYIKQDDIFYVKTASGVFKSICTHADYGIIYYSYYPSMIPYSLTDGDVIIWKDIEFGLIVNGELYRGFRLVNLDTVEYDGDHVFSVGDLVTDIVYVSGCSDGGVVYDYDISGDIQSSVEMKRSNLNKRLIASIYKTTTSNYGMQTDGVSRLKNVNSVFNYNTLFDSNSSIALSYKKVNDITNDLGISSIEISHNPIKINQVVSGGNLINKITRFKLVDDISRIKPSTLSDLDNVGLNAWRVFSELHREYLRSTMVKQFVPFNADISYSVSITNGLLNKNDIINTSNYSVQFDGQSPYKLRNDFVSENMILGNYGSYNAQQRQYVVDLFHNVNDLISSETTYTSVYSNNHSDFLSDKSLIGSYIKDRYAQSVYDNYKNKSFNYLMSVTDDFGDFNVKSNSVFSYLNSNIQTIFSPDSLTLSSSVGYDAPTVDNKRFYMLKPIALMGSSSALITSYINKIDSVYGNVSSSLRKYISFTGMYIKNYSALRLVIGSDLTNNELFDRYVRDYIENFSIIGINNSAVENSIESSFAFTSGASVNLNLDNHVFNVDSNLDSTTHPKLQGVIDKSRFTKSFIKYKMQFVYSKEFGRFICTTYRQYPVTFIQPYYGNHTLTKKHKSLSRITGGLLPINTKHFKNFDLFNVGGSYAFNQITSRKGYINPVVTSSSITNKTTVLSDNVVLQMYVNPIKSNHVWFDNHLIYKSVVSNSLSIGTLIPVLVKQITGNSPDYEYELVNKNATYIGESKIQVDSNVYEVTEVLNSFITSLVSRINGFSCNGYVTRGTASVESYDQTSGNILIKFEWNSTGSNMSNIDLKVNTSSGVLNNFDYISISSGFGYRNVFISGGDIHDLISNDFRNIKTGEDSILVDYAYSLSNIYTIANLDVIKYRESSVDNFSNTYTGASDSYYNALYSNTNGYYNKCTIRLKIKDSVNLNSLFSLGSVYKMTVSDSSGKITTISNVGILPRDCIVSDITDASVDSNLCYTVLSTHDDYKVVKVTIYNYMAFDGLVFGSFIGNLNVLSIAKVTSTQVPSATLLFSGEIDKSIYESITNVSQLDALDNFDYVWKFDDCQNENTFNGDYSSVRPMVINKYIMPYVVGSIASNYDEYGRLVTNNEYVIDDYDMSLKLGLNGYDVGGSMQGDGYYQANLWSVYWHKRLSGGYPSDIPLPYSNHMVDHVVFENDHNFPNPHSI